MIFKLLNFAAFQLTWPLTVISAAKGQPLIGVLATVVWASLHLLFMKQHRLEVLFLLMSAACMGILLETLLMLLNIVHYPLPAQTGTIAPLWIIALWVNVALTLNHCLSWINQRIKTAFILGLIFGPLAYNAGMRLDAIVFDPISGSISIAIMWGLSMPALILLNRFFHNQNFNSSSMDVI